MVIFDCLGAHVIGTKITFPRNVNGACVRATRLPTRTVGEKRKLDDVCSIELLKQLDHPIPPLPVETRSKEMCLTTFSDTGGIESISSDYLVEPLPIPPLSQVLGETDLSPILKSKGVALAALTPGALKHGSTVNINHLHVSLGHAHDEILRKTAQQHGIRLTGELVSCSECSRAKGTRASTPHRTTRRATRRMDLVYIDTAGPYPASLGGSLLWDRNA